MEVIKQCTYCKGTGRKYGDYTYTDTCPVCDGAGNIVVPTETICNYCKGTGRKYGDYTYTDICPNCNGSGVKSLKGFF